MILNTLIVILTFSLWNLLLGLLTNTLCMVFFGSFIKIIIRLITTKKFQKNDYFFLIFAIPSILCFVYGAENYSYLFFIGIGIVLYGLAYFIIHEIIIHRRLPPPSKTKNKYIIAIRKAHKIHHKNRNKEHCINFGMLIVPRKYFK